MTLRLNLINSLILLAVLLPGYSAADNPPVIKIAALLHLTGEPALQGEAFREGAELAAEQINRSGGISGRRLEIVFEDTQYTAIRTLSAAQKVVQDPLVVGALISTLTEAKSAVPVLERAHLPTIVLWDSSPELDSAGDYIFGIGPWIPDSGRVSAEFATKSLNAKSSVVFATNTEWSSTLADNFTNSFEASGGTIKGSFLFNPGDPDFRAAIVKAKNLNPDIFYAPVDSAIVGFFRQMRELAPTAKIITSDIITNDYLREDAPIFEGVYQSMPTVPGADSTKQMLEAYEKKFKHPCNQSLFVAWGFDGINILAESIRRAGVSREKVKDAIYTIHDFKGASSTITFNSMGSASTPITVFTVKDHNLVQARIRSGGISPERIPPM